MQSSSSFYKLGIFQIVNYLILLHSSDQNPKLFYILPFCFLISWWSVLSSPYICSFVSWFLSVRRLWLSSADIFIYNVMLFNSSNEISDVSVMPDNTSVIRFRPASSVIADYPGQGNMRVMLDLVMFYIFAAPSCRTAGQLCSTLSSVTKQR